LQRERRVRCATMVAARFGMGFRRGAKRTTSIQGRGMMTGALMLGVGMRVVSAKYYIVPIGQHVLGSDYDGQCEVASYSPELKKVICAGGDAIYELDMSSSDSFVGCHANDLSTMKDFSGNGANSCATCGTKVACATIDSKTTPGKLRVADLTGKTVATATWADAAVGYNPDDVKFSADCNTVYIPNEGEPDWLDSTNITDFMNPEGSVSVVDVEDVTSPTATSADFQAWNSGSKYEDAMAAGIRHVWKGEAEDCEGDDISDEARWGSFAQDIEPEYVTTIPGNTEYILVGLQEQNAIALVKVSGASPAIEKIFPLGYRKWDAQVKMDVNNEDAEGVLGMHKVNHFRLPDSILAREIGGKIIVFTANEGDSKEIISDEIGSNVCNQTALGDDWADIQDDGEWTFWTEEKRGKKVTPVCTDEGDLVCSDELPKYTDEETAEGLGRLKLLVTGLPTTDAPAINSFSMSTRSISAFELDLSAKTLTLIADSEDLIERVTLANFPGDHNREEELDDRSDDKGPEPESLAYGKTTDGADLLFLGCERSNAILTFDISGFDSSDSDFSNSFNDLIIAGRDSSVTDGSEPEKQRQSCALGYAADPESMAFVAAADNAYGKDVLLVAGAYSATLAVYAVCECSTIPSLEDRLAAGASAADDEDPCACNDGPLGSGDDDSAAEFVSLAAVSLSAMAAFA